MTFTKDIRMTQLPRIMTVDPSGMAARLVRASVDLLGKHAITYDIPYPFDALDEIERAAFDLVVTTLSFDDGLSGIDFAMRVKEMRPEVSVIVLSGAHHDAIDVDPRAASPFLILQYPFDAALLLRAVTAGIEGRDVLTAQFEPSVRLTITDAADIGAIPHIDAKAAASIIDGLLSEIGAMAILLSNRAGGIVHERGTVGYFNREQLSASLLPSAITTFEIGKLVGGKASAVTFYDGDEFDVFVLSVGLHHMLSLVWDGATGRSQFGAVNRYGRRAAEDLVALIGASAYMFEAERQERATMEMKRAVEIASQSDPEPQPIFTPPVEEKRRGRGRKNNDYLQDIPSRRSSEPLILRSDEIEQVSLPENEPLRLDPLLDLNPDLLDPSLLDTLDIDANDMFDMEKLGELANETRRERGPLSYDEARELGIIP